ncbi:MAG: phosphoribosylaminoimidazolesuccinocarboxamide synthase [Patescibacteria group bacterium]
MKLGPEQLLTEGKTKQVFDIGNGEVLLRFKDAITAGDGAKKDALKGKGALACQASIAIFELLNAAGVPTAYLRPGDNPNEMVMKKVDMIELEVVARRSAHGSYLQRMPHLEKGQAFPQLLVEFFLKTTGKKWGEIDLPCDDPLIVPHWSTGHVGDLPFWQLDHSSIMLESMEIFEPKQPWYLKKKIPADLRNNWLPKHAAEHWCEIDYWTRLIFFIFERAWQLRGFNKADFKLEFGVTEDGRLLLADEVTADNWRVTDSEGKYRDKQFYREGGALDEMLELYRWTLDEVKSWRIPKSHVLIWTGSEKDNIDDLGLAFERLTTNPYCERTDWVEMAVLTKSMHKSPVHGTFGLNKILQRNPETVVIAFIGRSNGAGPTLSANCSVPVISVPNGWEKRPEDVWSSLRTPSMTPASTILDPGNAMLHALQILGRSNPVAYAYARQIQEQTQSNFTLL